MKILDRKMIVVASKLNRNVIDFCPISSKIRRVLFYRKVNRNLTTEKKIYGTSSRRKKIKNHSQNERWNARVSRTHSSCHIEQIVAIPHLLLHVFVVDVMRVAMVEQIILLDAIADWNANGNWWRWLIIWRSNRSSDRAAALLRGICFTMAAAWALAHRRV